MIFYFSIRLLYQILFFSRIDSRYRCIMAAIEASPVPKKSTGFELSPVFGLVLFMFEVLADVRVRPPELPPVD